MRRVREAGTARAADDVHDQPRPELRVRGSSSRAAARSSTSGALSGWIRPTKVSTIASGGKAEQSPGRRTAARGEPVEVDAGVDHADLVRVGAVEVDQLRALVGGVGDQPVRGLDDLALADDPRGRLGGVSRGQRGVLDLGHRVHGVDQRDAPALLGQPADLAREPVVAVHEVVVAGLAAGLRAQDAAGQRAQLGGQVLLGQALERPGHDVPDEDAGSQLDGRRQVAARGAGEDLDLGAERGEPAGQLDDVDVHAARVAGARAGPAVRCAR